SQLALQATDAAFHQPVGSGTASALGDRATYSGLCDIVQSQNCSPAEQKTSYLVARLLQSQQGILDGHSIADVVLEIDLPCILNGVGNAHRRSVQIAEGLQMAQKNVFLLLTIRSGLAGRLVRPISLLLPR